MVLNGGTVNEVRGLPANTGPSEVDREFEQNTEHKRRTNGVEMKAGIKLTTPAPSPPAPRHGPYRGGPGASKRFCVSDSHKIGRALRSGG